QEPSLCLFQGLIKIGDRKKESDRPGLGAALLGSLSNVDNLGIYDLFQVLGQMLELLSRDGHKAPIVIPGVIIDAAQSFDFIGEVLKVDGSQRKPILGSRTLGNALELLRLEEGVVLDRVRV